jgi:uncharacterized membrane protein YhhN
VLKVVMAHMLAVSAPLRLATIVPERWVNPFGMLLTAVGGYLVYK